MKETNLKLIFYAKYIRFNFNMEPKNLTNFWKSMYILIRKVERKFN